MWYEPTEKKKSNIFIDSKYSLGKKIVSGSTRQKGEWRVGACFPFLYLPEN